MSLNCSGHSLAGSVEEDSRPVSDEENPKALMPSERHSLIRPTSPLPTCVSTPPYH
jgi:hypothetical protein